MYETLVRLQLDKNTEWLIRMWPLWWRDGAFHEVLYHESTTTYLLPFVVNFLPKLRKSVWRGQSFHVRSVSGGLSLRTIFQWLKRLKSQSWNNNPNLFIFENILWNRKLNRKTDSTFTLGLSSQSSRLIT